MSAAAMTNHLFWLTFENLIKSGPYISEFNIMLWNSSIRSVTGDIVSMHYEKVSLFYDIKAFWNIWNSKNVCQVLPFPAFWTHLVKISISALVNASNRNFIGIIL